MIILYFLIILRFHIEIILLKSFYFKNKGEDMKKKINRELIEAMENNIPILRIEAINDNTWEIDGPRRFMIVIKDHVFLVPEGATVELEDKNVLIIPPEECDKCKDKCFDKPIGTIEEVMEYRTEQEEIMFLEQVDPQGSC